MLSLPLKNLACLLTDFLHFSFVESTSACCIQRNERRVTPPLSLWLGSNAV
jgi:hypothetical protein